MENDVTEWSNYLLNWMTMPSRRQSMITGRKLSRRPSRRKRRNQRRGKPRQRQPPFLAKLGTTQVLLPSKFHLRFPPVLLAAASGEKRAALPAGSLKFDDVNHGYYEAVQHDQDAILRHFGKAYASEGIGHCFQRLSWGRRHSGLEFLLDDSF